MRGRLCAMSKHVKRLSVFERLGPGTEPEPQHAPSRHRHYQVERPSERSIHSIPLEERTRDKKTGEQEVSSHKHHVEPENKSGGRRSSRITKPVKERGGGKPDHLYQAHSADRGKGRPGARGESASSNTSGSMSDGEKEGLDERSRRRTRDSLSGRRSRAGKEVSSIERRERGEHSRVERGGDEQQVTDSVKPDEDRRRRKRDRERASLGDGDGVRQAKRAHTESESSVEQLNVQRSDSDTRTRYAKERQADRREHLPSEKRQRLMGSLSDSEPATPGCGELSESLLDWSSIAKLPLPLPPPQSVSTLDQFEGGAVLAGVGCSSFMAGESLAAEVVQAVSRHVQVTQANLLPERIIQEPFGSESLACAGASYLQEQVHQANLLYDLRPCRRALTAQADCQMRKKLRSTATGKEACFTPQAPPGSWHHELYASSVTLYQSLGKKAGSSSKPPLRLHSSHLGSVLVPR